MSNVTTVTKLNRNKPLFDQLVGDLLDVEKAFGTEFGRFKNLNVFCPYCEVEGHSKSPSCSVSTDGMFHCKSCGRRGTAAVFFAQRERVPIQQARQVLKMSPEKAQRWAQRLGKPAKPIGEDLVQRCHEALLRSTVEMTYLTGAKRGLTVDTLKKYKIGKDEYRITIPVYSRGRQLHGIRRYLPSAKNKPKMVSHEGGSGAPVLYPWNELDTYVDNGLKGSVILCEGEWDCLLLKQHGFMAVTATSGVRTWFEDWTYELLTLGRPVVIIYDVNDEPDETGQPDLGQRVAVERAYKLHQAGLSVKIVKLPLKYSGGDVTDWFTRARKTAEELRDLIDKTPRFNGKEPKPTNTSDAQDNGHLDDGGSNGKIVDIVHRTINPEQVTLHDASLSKYLYKAITVKCLVAGKVGAPYLLPVKVQAEVADEEGNLSTVVKSFDPWDGRILSLIKCTSASQNKALKALMGIEQGAKAAIQVLESANVEEIFLIPAIDHENDQGPYVQPRQCFYVGHGICTNQVYQFEGYTLPDPRSQAATHILTSATPAATDLENFELTKDQFRALEQAFQTDDVFAKLDDIAEQFAAHVTDIFGRKDLHTAIDLVFHSPISFDFDGTRVRKGWLEALILGDTRTGKGFVAEKLIHHYGVGEVVSCEYTTLAGIVGGINKMGEQHVLQWGKVPLANKRLIVLDEASNLSYGDIGHLSRIRSEGIVEITKIITEKTSAQTRLIWLANPRRPLQGLPKKMADYTFGVEAVPELIGNAEDIARFDYVLTVARGEVKSKVINELKRKKEANTKPLVYTSELCRKLIVWVWSRKPEHIKFQTGVIELILKSAQALGALFSPTICLVQAEDVRFKLARIACAAAARTFSSEDGVHLIVRKEHVEFAYNFLHYIYSKPSCGYAQLSLAERERSTLRDPQDVLVCLQQVGDLFPDLVSGLLEQSTISARDLCDYAGVDIYQARSIISELVRLRALTKDYQHYRKKPAFKQFLQNLQMQITRDPHHVTVEDDEDTLPTEGDGK